MTTRALARIPIRAPRRPRQWALAPTGIGSVIGTTEATKLFFDLQAALETDLAYNLNNVTASAIRLDISIIFQTGGTVGQLSVLHFGIGWFQDDAIAAGVASLPNPSNDSFDWMAHRKRAVVCETTGANLPRGGTFQIYNDSMRKQRENHSTLGMVVSATTLLQEVDISVGGRTLFLLP